MNINILKNKLIIKTIVLSAIFVSFNACIGTGSCGDYFPYFQIVTTTLNHYSRTDTSTIEEVGLNGLTAMSEGSIINYDQYVLSLDIKQKFITEKKPDFSGGGMAYALSCSENGESGTKSGLQSIDVITLYDYNENYKANDTINDILFIYNYENAYYSSVNWFYNFSNFRETMKNSLRSKEINFVFREAPSQQEKSAFRVVLKMKDGTYFGANSSVIYLKP